MWTDNKYIWNTLTIKIQNPALRDGLLSIWEAYFLCKHGNTLTDCDFSYVIPLFMNFLNFFTVMEEVLNYPPLCFLYMYFKTKKECARPLNLILPFSLLASGSLSSSLTKHLKFPQRAYFHLAFCFLYLLSVTPMSLALSFKDQLKQNLL